MEKGNHENRQKFHWKLSRGKLSKSSRGFAVQVSENRSPDVAEVTSVHVLHSHLYQFKQNLEVLSGEEGECFHQDVQRFEKRY